MADDTIRVKGKDAELLTGQDALDALTDGWQDLGQGKVDVEYVPPYFRVRRANGDYTMFISLADDTAVYIGHPNATTRDIPDEERPDAEVDEQTANRLVEVFDHAGGGMFPNAEAGGFKVQVTLDGKRQSALFPIERAGIEYVSL